MMQRTNLFVNTDSLQDLLGREMPILPGRQEYVSQWSFGMGVESVSIIIVHTLGPR